MPLLLREKGTQREILMADFQRGKYSPRSQMTSSGSDTTEKHYEIV